MYRSSKQTLQNDTTVNRATVKPASVLQNYQVKMEAQKEEV